MKKIILAVALFAPLAALAAEEIKSTTTGIVKQSEYQLVAKDNSIVGAAVGGVAGGAVGNEMGATETFQCKMIIESDGKQHLMQTIANKKPEVGKSVTVVELVDGTREVM